MAFGKELCLSCGNKVRPGSPCDRCDDGDADLLDLAPEIEIEECTV